MNAFISSFTRRRALVLLSSFAVAAPLAQAQTFPSRPLRLLVGFPAGSSTDLMARELAEGIKEALGQAVIVENIPGAGSSIAASRAARAAPDGYTLYLALLSHLFLPYQHKNLPYDTLNDFAPVARISDTRFLVVANPKVPGANLEEFVEAAKAAPGKYTYGSSGIGAGNHLMMEMFAGQAGIQLLHVPYKSATEALNAVLAGDIDLTFFNAPPIVEHLQRNTLKTFGVGGTERSPFAPQVPSMKEAGYPDFEASTYNFILAPRGVPEPVLDLLNRTINAHVASPAFRERIKALGATPSPPQTPAELTAYLRDEMDNWGKVVRASGVEAQ
ncbi:MAG: Bug family tripartite tricarboxylate transporter substrate binding protein [Pigmentiphaga sp.]